MKSVLISVSGMSPAILTETVWALATDDPGHAVIPDEVIVITTVRGEQDIRSLLLSPQEAWGNRTVWESLRRDVFKLRKLPAKSAKLQLAVRVIDLPDAETGVRVKAEDLRTQAENEEAADFILQTVSPYVDADDVTVVASIAGGRKTMGALLYAAMSLVGRDRDRVTHVLVSEPFEQCRGFFYPGQPVQELEAGRPGNLTPVRAAEARIDLGEVPFVPLRNGFADLGEARRSFSGLVARYSREIRQLSGPPDAALDQEKRVLVVNDRRIPLTGRDLVVIWYLYDRARAGSPHFSNRIEAADAIDAWYPKWRETFPQAAAGVRLTSVSAEDVTRVLDVLRKNLKEKGLDNLIPYLAPRRGRIGFDLQKN